MTTKTKKWTKKTVFDHFLTILTMVLETVSTLSARRNPKGPNCGHLCSNFNQKHDLMSINWLLMEVTPRVAGHFWSISEDLKISTKVVEEKESRGQGASTLCNEQGKWTLKNRKKCFLRLSPYSAQLTRGCPCGVNAVHYLEFGPICSTIGPISPKSCFQTYCIVPYTAWVTDGRGLKMVSDFKDFQT